MPKELANGKSTTRRYSSEEKAAAVRMVRTLRAELGVTQGTVQRVARQLGYGVESVRMWALNYVRNRAAHHEPIHQHDLGKDLQFALDLAGWISPTAQRWVTLTTSLPSVIAEQP